MAAKKKGVRTLMTSYLRQMSLTVLRRTSKDNRHVFSEEYVQEWCSNLHSKFIQLSECNIHYRLEGQGPVLVLVHGFGGSLHNWSEWVNILKDRFTILRFDLPGFGLSSPIRRKVEILWFVDQFREFLDKLGFDQVYLCGNSLGGWLSWEFTAKYPSYVKKLVLMNAAGYFEEVGKPSGIELMSKAQFRKLVRTGVPKMIVRAIASTSFGDKSRVPEELVFRTYLMINREGMLASMIYVASSDAKASNEVLHTISTPCLIMWGDRDRVIPVSHADLFYSDLLNSKLIIYKGIGHVPMMELPTKSASDLVDFLSV